MGVIDRICRELFCHGGPVSDLCPTCVSLLSGIAICTTGIIVITVLVVAGVLA